MLSRFVALRKSALLAFSILFFALSARSQTLSANPADDQEIQSKVDALLARMTTGEKIGQLNQLFVFDHPEKVEGRVATGEVGSLLFVTDPAVINHMQHLAVEKSRLHIPLIFGYDVIHGFRTIFPVPLAMASSWDPETVVRAQTVAAAEARSVGIAWAFAPMLDIARDPRWGRIVEGAGEDPFLGSALAAAQVRGFQGPYIGAPDHVLACMKHFAGYGAAEGGRDYDASYISEVQMQNIYLPPFHAAVKAGVGSVMSAYMDLNDVPASGNRWLLHDVLRDEWGFKGFVVSDADAVNSLQIHGFAKDRPDAAVRGLTAGVDMEMALDSTAYSVGLAAALQSGKVTMQQIEDADRRILAMKFRLGLFQHPYVDEARAKQVLTDPAHRAEARRAADHSMVLLRNEGNILPLKKNGYAKIAVIGPLGDSGQDIIGPWAFQEDLPETITVLEGLRNKLGPQAQVSFAQGVQISRKFPSFFDAIFHVKDQPAWSPEEAASQMSKAISLAGSSDLTILVLGEAQNMSGEAASRESLEQPGKEQQLLEAVVAAGKTVVLVMLNGRPLDLRWASQHVPAILEAWYPGTQGGNAVADILYGDAVPGGKLPIAWPRSVGQIPINYAHNTTQSPEKQNQRYWEEESAPLFPFGYGLSYSTFAFSNLKVSRPAMKAGDKLEVSAEVENTGNLAADEVAQLYIHQQYGNASRPVRELKGFSRITLAPHEKKTVRFQLGQEELTYWSAAKKGWTEDASDFDVWVGGDSTAQLHATFSITE